MKVHEYKMKGATIPTALHGRILKQNRPETVEDFKTLIVDGDETRIVSLASQQLMLNGQRAAKDVAESEEVAKLIAEGNVDAAWDLVQRTADEYRDNGGRANAKPSEARVAKATVSKLAAAQATNPKLAKMLADLGITV